MPGRAGRIGVWSRPRRRAPLTAHKGGGGSAALTRPGSAAARPRGKGGPEGARPGLRGSHRARPARPEPAPAPSRPCGLALGGGSRFSVFPAGFAVAGGSVGAWRGHCCPGGAPGAAPAPSLPSPALVVCLLQLGAAAEFECAGLGLAKPLAGMGVLLWWRPPPPGEPGLGRGEGVRVTARPHCRPAILAFLACLLSFSVCKGKARLAHSPEQSGVQGLWGALGSSLNC